MSTLDGVGDRLLVIFDGHCGLCNGWVRWLQRQDQRDRLRFAAASSPSVQSLLDRCSEVLEPGGAPRTLLVVRNPGAQSEQMLVRSQSVLSLLKELPQPWPMAAAALGLIPRSLGDVLYRFVARWRYRIWGRLEDCPLPSAEVRARFL